MEIQTLLSTLEGKLPYYRKQEPNVRCWVDICFLLHNVKSRVLSIAKDLDFIPFLLSSSPWLWAPKRSCWQEQKLPGCCPFKTNCRCPCHIASSYFPSNYFPLGSWDRCKPRLMSFPKNMSKHQFRSVLLLCNITDSQPTFYITNTLEEVVSHFLFHSKYCSSQCYA